MLSSGTYQASTRNQRYEWSHRILLSDFQAERSDLFLPSISKLVNVSLSEGRFPTEVQEGCYYPSYSEAIFICDNLKNYVPVSGLCFMSKLVVKLSGSSVIISVVKT